MVWLKTGPSAQLHTQKKLPLINEASLKGLERGHFQLSKRFQNIFLFFATEEPKSATGSIPRDLLQMVWPPQRQTCLEFIDEIYALSLQFASTQPFPSMKSVKSRRSVSHFFERRNKENLGLTAKKKDMRNSGISLCVCVFVCAFPLVRLFLRKRRLRWSPMWRWKENSKVLSNKGDTYESQNSKRLIFKLSFRLFLYVEVLVSFLFATKIVIRV